jgi:hypothetical protein
VIDELLQLVPGLRADELELHELERDGTRFCEIRIPAPLWSRAVEETAVPEIERDLELEEIWLARGVELADRDVGAVGFQFPVEEGA